MLGCGALAVRGGYAELKSMFTAEAARGRGVGRAVLARLEAEALELRLDCLRLETGNLLHAAIRLYRRAGFVEVAPFGSYEANQTSLFMEKLLGEEGGVKEG